MGGQLAAGHGHERPGGAFDDLQVADDEASSNVIEQNACSRSPGSSMSLTRTSVISTAVLLTIRAHSTATSHGKHATHAACLQTSRDTPRMARVTAKSKVRRATSTHSVPQAILLRETPPAAASIQGDKRLGGRLQPVQQQPARLSPISSLQVRRPTAAASCGSPPAGRRRTRPPSTIRPAAEPPRNAACRCRPPAPPVLLVRGKRPGRRRGRTARRCPIRRPTSANSSRDQPSRQPSLAATSAAAASLDPPPSPAAAGIRLTSRNVAPRRTPARGRTSSTARTTRFSGPSGTIEIARPPTAGARTRRISIPAARSGPPEIQRVV